MILPSFHENMASAMRLPKTLFPNELAFRQELEADDAFWRALGCHPNPAKATSGPDFLAKIADKRNNRTALGVKIEIEPMNFKLASGEAETVHLIVAVACGYWKREHKGIPVIALYRRCPDEWFRKSLDNDIEHIFHNRPLIDWATYE